MTMAIHVDKVRIHVSAYINMIIRGAEDGNNDQLR
jgi:hypothetical protein